MSDASQVATGRKTLVIGVVGLRTDGMSTFNPEYARGSLMDDRYEKWIKRR